MDNLGIFERFFLVKIEHLTKTVTNEKFNDVRKW